MHCRALGIRKDWFILPYPFYSVGDFSVLGHGGALRDGVHCCPDAASIIVFTGRNKRSQKGMAALVNSLAEKQQVDGLVRNSNRLELLYHTAMLSEETAPVTGLLAY